MNGWQDTLVPALGWALVDFVWQGAVLGLLAWSGLTLLRDARPQARYALLLATLALCVALPAASVLRSLVGTAPTLAGSLVHGLLAGDDSARTAIDSNGGSWRDLLQPRLPQLVAAWSLGAALLALRFALGLAWIGQVRHAGALPAFDWQARLERVAAAVGLSGPPELRLVDGLDGPAVAGIWRPVVLMPVALLARMPADLLEALLAHELAHVRRHDYLVNLLQGVVETLLFYHPLVWWLSRRVRVEREEIADDLALQAIGEPRRLALALQRLDQWQAEAALDRGLAPIALAPAAHGGHLMNRIRRLVQPRAAVPTWKSGLPLLAVGALCVAVYAQAMPSPTAQRDSYALVRHDKEGMTFSGDSNDMGDLRTIRTRLHGDFLWFQRDGKSYVVQDPALIAEAQDAWKPSEALSVKMEALSREMQPHSQRMDELSKQMDALSTDTRPQQARMEALSEQMRPLAEQQRVLAGKMQAVSERMRGDDGADAHEALSREMEALQAQMEPIGEQMSALGDKMSLEGASMQRAHEPMQALSEQMQEASKPMEALGKRMEVLGKQQEKVSHAADARLQRLIDRALREGKAQRSDSLRSN